MPTVTELTALYGNFMLGPRPGIAVCEVCFDLTGGQPHCYWCTQTDQWLDAVAPVSYSVGHEQLHHVLAGYKRAPTDVASRFQVELAAVLWRYLAAHENCVARAAGVQSFELVTTVPSSIRERAHPLERIVGELVAPTRGRHERLLWRTSVAVEPHQMSAEKFDPARELEGDTVLLIDDTWTTGANAQSAAAALKRGGAHTVAAVVIGRHLNREYGHNDRRLRALTKPFDWDACALHQPLRALGDRSPIDAGEERFE